MLKISREQIALLAPAVEQGFEQRVIDYLYEHHTGAVDGLSPQRLRERVRAALSKARRHGFDWQSALVGFTVLVFELGPHFDRHPAFRRALAIRLPDQNRRIAAIYANVTDEDWVEARALAAPDDWHDGEPSKS
jgi:hypothetical protein